MTTSALASRPRPQPDFDAVARVYRWAEYCLLGPLLNRTREQFLDRISSAQHVLALGDGDGRFSARLLQRNSTSRLTAVDLSACMLRLLERRCERAGVAARLHLHQTSLCSPLMQLDLASVDLIATHFVLDCLDQHQIEALARQLGSSVAPNCLWVVSEFAQPPRQPWRSLGRAYIRALYWAFRVLTGLQIQTLPDPQRALEMAGFLRLARVDRLQGLLYSELWTLVPPRESR